MKKNEYFKATCVDMTHDGKGVVKVDGFAYFVKGLITGEVANLKVIKTLKSYGIARIIDLVEVSKYRQDPICPIYKSCGGCHIQHVNNEGQQFFKTKRTKDAMQRIGKCAVEVKDCLMMEEPYYYRNKVQVPVGNSKDGLVSGFYKEHSNDIVPFDVCYIQNMESNKIVKRVKELLSASKEVAYDKRSDKGNIRHILTKYGHTTKEIMLVIITRHKKVNNIKQIVNTITKEFPMIKTVIQNINTKNDNVVLGVHQELLFGDGYITDVLLGNTYKISLFSFYQINPVQVETLYQTAIDYANLKPTDVVIDAYCGIGTITLSLAKYVKEVHGVEIIPQAIRDAKNNAVTNKIKNAKFTCIDAGEFMVECANNKKSIDVVFVDPPRKGCSPVFLEALIKLSPSKVVYVSCDVSTQARDIAILEQNGYVSKTCQPVDMFPHTNHVESIVLLQRVD